MIYNLLGAALIHFDRKYEEKSKNRCFIKKFDIKLCILKKILFRLIFSQVSKRYFPRKEDESIHYKFVIFLEPLNSRYFVSLSHIISLALLTPLFYKAGGRSPGSQSATGMAETEAHSLPNFREIVETFYQQNFGGLAL